MALSLRNKHLEELARHLANERGISITDAILEALQIRLNHLGPGSRLAHDLTTIEKITKRVAELPLLSEEEVNDILGYNQDGLPS